MKKVIEVIKLSRILVQDIRGEASRNEKDTFSDWMLESEENRNLYDDLRKEENIRESFMNYESFDAESSWENLQPRIETKVRRLIQPVYYKAAAVFIPLLLATTIFLLVNNERDEVVKADFTAPAEEKEQAVTLIMADGSVVNVEELAQASIEENDGTRILTETDQQISYEQKDSVAELIYNTVEVPHGKRFSIVLADGSLVRLNAQSTLRFPVQFQEGKREVFLDGEGYFEVTRDEASPFSVTTGNGKVAVLGTVFNVSDYPDEDYSAVTLVEGSVEVSNATDLVVLEPGEQSRVFGEDRQIVVQEVDPQFYTGWIDGLFEFDNQRLDFILGKLSRWYDVSFTFDDMELKSQRFTGAIESEDDIETVLDRIGRTTDIQFDLSGNNISVKKSNS